MSNRLKFELLCFFIALTTLRVPDLVEFLLLPMEPTFIHVAFYSLLSVLVIYYGLFRFLAYVKDHNYFEKEK